MIVQLFFCFAVFFFVRFALLGFCFTTLLAVRTLERCYCCCCCCGYLIPLLQFIRRAANALSIYLTYLVNCTNDTFLTSANFSIWSSSSS